MGPNLELFGDCGHVFIVDLNESGAVRSLRAFRAGDGAAVPVPDAADSYARKVRVLGRCLLVSDGVEGGRWYCVFTTC